MRTIIIATPVLYNLTIMHFPSYTIWMNCLPTVCSGHSNWQVDCIWLYTVIAFSIA